MGFYTKIKCPLYGIQDEKEVDEMTQKSLTSMRKVYPLSRTFLQNRTVKCRRLYVGVFFLGIRPLYEVVYDKPAGARKAAVSPDCILVKGICP